MGRNIIIKRNEQGYYGLVDIDTNENVVSCVFDEITIRKGMFFCRIWKDYITFSLDGTPLSLSRHSKILLKNSPYYHELEKSRHFNALLLRKCLVDVPLEEEDGIFIKYENGKFGVLDMDKNEILPCEFDEVWRWRDCEVIYSRKGTEHYYYNLRGEPILTKARYVLPELEIEPYSMGEPQNDIALMTMEFVDECYDEQCCICYGHPTRLDRVLRQEIEGRLRAHCEVIKYAPDDFHDFNAWDTYIYSAYIARSRRENPIGDCVRQLLQMRCYSSSWQYIDKVLTNKNTKLKNEELQLLQLACDDAYESSRATKIAYGYDDSLADGEVKVFHIEFFQDHWPDADEFLKAEPSYDAIHNSYTCKEVNTILDKSMPEPSYNIICRWTSDFVSPYSNWNKQHFCYNAIKWALKRGISPNVSNGLGKLALDYIYEKEKDEWLNKQSNRYRKLFEQLKVTLIKHGALTFEEYKKQNPFYNEDDFAKYDD